MIDGRSRQRSLPLSIRLVLTYALLVTATLMFVASLALHLTRRHLIQSLDSSLTAVAESFREGPARTAEQPEDLGAQAHEWLAVQAFPEGQMSAVRTSSGEILSSSGGLDLSDVPGGLGMLTAVSSRWWDVEAPSGSVRALSVPLMKGDRQIGTLVVAASRTRLESTLQALLYGIGIASGAGLALSSVLGFFVVRRTMRPLTHISDEIQAIEFTADLSRRVDAPGPADEVGRLAEAFDRMLSRLEDLSETKKRFLAEASHELRTPLTVARGKLELSWETLPPSEVRGSIAVAMEELDRMSRIVDDLLLLAKLEEGLRFEPGPVEAELILREGLLRGLGFELREVEIDAPPGIFALADPERTLQVVTNLVANAVRHAGEEARITLRARTEDSLVIMEVSDTGRGIADEDLPHIFERFYRGRKSRSEALPGSGLGLAIASSLVQAMGGTISASGRPGLGVTFTVTLPVADAPVPVSAMT